MPLFDFYIMVDWSGAARERGTFLVRVTRGGLPLHPTKTSASATVTAIDSAARIRRVIGWRTL
jgi:hypothetical protein